MGVSRPPRWVHEGATHEGATHEGAMALGRSCRAVQPLWRWGGHQCDGLAPQVLRREHLLRRLRASGASVELQVLPSSFRCFRRASGASVELLGRVRRI
jgi:hypothetical protein